MYLRYFICCRLLLVLLTVIFEFDPGIHKTDFCDSCFQMLEEMGKHHNHRICIGSGRDGSSRDKIHIDLRESVFNFQEQQVFTKDTVLVDVDAVMYYKIVDVKKAVYEIDDLQVALCNTAQTQLKEVFGNLTFTQALQSQTSINEHLLEAFGKIFSRWGVECIRM